MPKASAATSSRCPLTRGSSSRPWTSPTSTASRDSRRRSPSSRRRARTTRARPSAQSPRSTTTCGCCTRAPALPRCPDHGIELTAQTVSQMVDQVLKLPEGTAAALLAPVVSDARASIASCFEDLAAQGFVRVRIDGRIHELDALPGARRKSASIPSRRWSTACACRAGAAQRLAESFETALRLSGGIARLVLLDEPERESEPRQQDAQVELTFSSRHACPVCGYSVPPLEPKLFSFNNPAGACPSVRRPRRAGVLRSAARGAASAAVARRRRGARLGPPQRALLPAHPVARATLRLRHRDALDGAARHRCSSVLLERQRTEEHRASATARAAAARASAIRSRASCPT